MTSEGPKVVQVDRVKGYVHSPGVRCSSLQVALRLEAIALEAIALRMEAWSGLNTCSQNLLLLQIRPARPFASKLHARDLLIAATACKSPGKVSRPGADWISLFRASNQRQWEPKAVGVLQATGVSCYIRHVKTSNLSTGGSGNKSTELPDRHENDTHAP